MKPRLSRSARKHVTLRVVIGQGRAHGRLGWVTQSIVAHAMQLRPGSYVLGLLMELHEEGVLQKSTTRLVNGTTRYEFRAEDPPDNSEEIPF